MPQGMWLTSFSGGPVADLPSDFPGDGNLAFYFATDTATLYVAMRPDLPTTTATWQALLSTTPADMSFDATGQTLVMPNLPTSEPATVGALWSNSGVVTVSDGP